MKALELNPNEMAFRKIYKPYVESEKLTVVFRPGNRACGNFRGYCAGQVVDAKILNNIGADWAGIQPTFINGFSKQIKILSVEIRRIDSLVESDFVGASADIHNKQSLIYNLGVIYNLSPSEITSNSIITKTSFCYLN